MKILDAIIAIECPKNKRIQDICDCIEPGNRCKYYKGVDWYDDGTNDAKISGIKCNYDELKAETIPELLVG